MVLRRAVQTKQSRLEDALGASRADMVESIVALELQMAEVGQTAQTQQEVLVKHQSHNKNSSNSSCSALLSHAKQSKLRLRAPLQLCTRRQVV